MFLAIGPQNKSRKWFVFGLRPLFTDPCLTKMKEHFRKNQCLNSQMHQKLWETWEQMFSCIRDFISKDSFAQYLSHSKNSINVSQQKIKTNDWKFWGHWWSFLFWNSKDEESQSEVWTTYIEKSGNRQLVQCLKRIGWMIGMERRWNPINVFLFFAS